MLSVVIQVHYEALLACSSKHSTSAKHQVSVSLISMCAEKTVIEQLIASCCLLSTWLLDANSLGWGLPWQRHACIH